MTALQSLFPLELENHLVLNKKRLNTNEAQEESEGITKSRVGANFREVPMGCRRTEDGQMQRQVKPELDRTR